MAKISTAYLVAYNALQVAGWSYVFYLFLPHFVYLLENGSPSANLYQDIALPLRIFQVAAYLEVLHNLIGIVKSSPIITAVQVTSRVFLVCGICDNFKVVHSSIQLSTMVLAWCITEIIRYSYYMVSLINLKIGALTWLRYTLFIILYPLGAGSELLCIYKAFPDMAIIKPYDIEFPNAYNFTFSLQCLVILIVLSYLPGFPHLYFYMFAQRKKILGRKEGEKKTN